MLKVLGRACAAAFAASCLLASPVSAGTIVDTGTPPYDFFGRELNRWGFVAAEFSVADATKITGIESYVVETAGEGAGDYTIVLYAGGGDVPGAELYSAAVSYTGTDGWQGLSGLAWNVAAGTYWVGFEVRGDQAFGGMLPPDVPNPTGREAYYNGFSPGYQPHEYLDIALRVYGEAGTTGPVPEPGTWALMILGFGAVGAAVRRRRGLVA